MNPRYSATAYGMLNLVGVGVGGVMIYVGGLLRDHSIGLTTPFAISSMGLFVAGLLMLLVRPTIRPTPSG